MTEEEKYEQEQAENDKFLEEAKADLAGPTAPVGHGMSWAHLTFARVYHQTGSREAAVKAAGYKSNSSEAAGRCAYNLLRRPDIKRYLLYLSEKAEAVAIRSNAEIREEVHQITDEALGDARKGRPLIGKNGSAVLDDEGQVIRVPDVMAKIKVAELKGRMVGMFTDVQRIEGEMEGKSAEELGAFLRAAASDPLVASILSEVSAVRKAVLSWVATQDDEWMFKNLGISVAREESAEAVH